MPDNSDSARPCSAANAPNEAISANATSASRRMRLLEVRLDRRLCGKSRLRLPEIIEVEPVAGRFAQMMFQPLGITADVRVERGIAIGTREFDFLGQRFEDEIVTVAAAVHAETQHHRHL